MRRLLSLGEVARIVGVQTYQIEYAHATRKLTEPRTRFAGKRVYYEADLQMVADHFGVKLQDTGKEAK